MEMKDTIEIISNLVSIVTLVYVAFQLWEQNKAVLAQTKATEIETYVNINIEFLNTIGNFKEHINFPETTLKDLSSEEIRTLDKYFYLANVEYIMILEGTVKGELAEHWLKGMKSSAKKKPFIERWQQSASKYALNSKFVSFYDANVQEYTVNIGTQKAE